MSSDEFYQALTNNYPIPTLATAKHLEGDGKVLPYGVAESASYESPDGWRIELAGKSVTVFSVKPVAQRFN